MGFAQGGMYAKIEASFSISNLTTDPFDYTVTDVEVQILQPDGTTITLPAFFDGGTTWRVRHTPSITGQYRVVGITLNGQAIAAGSLQPGSWTVAGSPVNTGFVRVDPADPHHFITSNGRRYFPVGEDDAWDSGTHTVTLVMNRMGPARENWSRVWMNHWDGKNLDWPAGGPTLPRGQLNLSVAQKWDSIIAAAEQAGIRFQMTLQHHGQYSTTVDPNWPQNPYNTANTIGSTNGFLTDPQQFFTNATAIALTKRKLRYAVARWGYSTSIMAWELFNEVQFTDAGQNGNWGIVQSWHDQMATFLHQQDPYHHLVTTSSDLTEPIWDNTDYYTHHDYPSDLIDSLVDAPTISPSQPVAPVFGSECGTNGVPRLGVNAPIWAGLMNGQAGNEEPWWWDGMDAENDYIYFRAVSDFVTRSGLGNQTGLTQSIPQIVGGGSAPLVFAFGGGWGDAVQDTFTVGTTAPAGAGSAPSYLQGNYHRSMTPNGYTFLVNYPQAGTFSAQILEIALSGASFQISLDGVVQTNLTFPATSNDTATNLTIAIPVPAGSHSILLYNPSQYDWIDLGDFTFNPYVPGLAVYALGNTNFTAAWVWNRTNVYNTSASISSTGAITLTGLSASSYLATWWDTFADAPLSSFGFFVPSNNAPVTLPIPPVLRSAALYVGPPPKWQVSAPPLSVTLGTNAPSYHLPLTITNGGGLPVGYSLYVTGINPVVYRAMNSLQPGGPVFAWNDISAIGQEITANFTQLASPKTAKDEGIAGPVNIGFSFPFFSGAQTPGTFTNLYVSPNGFISFSPFTGDTSTNTTLPATSAPPNSIAFFWTDLDINASGHVYTFTDPIAGTFTLQFQGVRFKGTTSTANCQLILKTTGEILMEYQSLAVSNTCTIGVQDAARDSGTTVAFKQNYLQNNFAVQLSPVPWIQFSSTADYVPGSASDVVDLAFNSVGLAPGTYAARLVIGTTDPQSPGTTLPLSLIISNSLPAAPSYLAVDSVTWSHVALSWVDNSPGNETGFIVERKTGANGAFAPVGMVGPGLTNFTDASAASQTTYYYEVAATNATGTSFFSDPVGAITPLAPRDNWRFTNFGTVTNAGIAADTANPAGDGLVNIVKYAFDLDPHLAESDPISFSVVNDHLVITFKRPSPAPADINYLFDVANDLTSGIWNAGPSYTSQQVTPNGDGTETVSITDAAPLSATAAHYLRVRIGTQ